MLRHRHRLRAVAALASFVAIPLAPLLAAPTPACAATEPHAALVIDTGPRELRYCVAIDGASVSGIELIELAADQFGLDYGLGFGGDAVCRLARVGVDGGDCFSEFPRFWGYWRGTSAGWRWSTTGAADTVVRPGGVEGWSWGIGQDGATHPMPPATTLASVCGDPTPEPPQGGGAGERGGSASGSGGGADDPTPPGDGSAAQASDASSAGEPSTGRQAAAAGRPPRGGANDSTRAKAASADGGSQDAPRGASPADRASRGPGPATPSIPLSGVRAVPAAAGRTAGPPLMALASAGTAVALLVAAGWLATRRRREDR
jgi:hypothetical protein